MCDPRPFSISFAHERGHAALDPRGKIVTVIEVGGLFDLMPLFALDTRDARPRHTLVTIAGHNVDAIAVDGGRVITFDMRGKVFLDGIEPVAHGAKEFVIPYQ